MIATVMSALVIASMLKPNALWAFVFQLVLVLSILALIVRGLVRLGNDQPALPRDRKATWRS